MSTTFQWQVPNGVFFISVAVLGGGGGGAGDCTQQSTPWASGYLQDNFSGGGGGGGGGLSWANDLAVLPGSTITIIVGAGGAAGQFGSTVSNLTNPEQQNIFGRSGENGGNSSVSNGVWTVTGGGGGRGFSSGASRINVGTIANPIFSYSYFNGIGGTGGSSSSNGVGGRGGNPSSGFGFVSPRNKFGGGGGGAGGWSNNSLNHENGRGHGTNNAVATNGVSGGGGGGEAGGSVRGRNGNTVSWPYQGASPPILPVGNNTTPFGCGGGGANRRQGTVNSGSAGGSGRVRIMWNPPWDNDIRTYPTGGPQPL